MKHIAIACGVLALSACAQNAEINTRNADLPGIQTEINCNPEPTLVYSKTGQLIETAYPVLHPSCVVATNRAATTPLEEEARAAVAEETLLSRIANYLKLGPATSRNPSKLEADKEVIRELGLSDGSSDETINEQVGETVVSLPDRETEAPTRDEEETVEEEAAEETPGQDEEREEERPTEEEPAEEEAPSEEQPAEEEAPSEEREEERSKIEELKAHAGVDF